MERFSEIYADQQDSEIYMIGDLARLTGVSLHTINYYLRIGLLREKSRSQHNGYRYFDADSVRRLNLIKRWRLEHLPIRQIRQRLEDGVL